MKAALIFYLFSIAVLCAIVIAIVFLRDEYSLLQKQHASINLISQEGDISNIRDRDSVPNLDMTGIHLSKNKNKKTRGSKKKKVIFFYNPIDWWLDWIGTSRWENGDVFNNCQTSNCFLTQNYENFETSDVVVFNLQSIKEFPSHKPTGQIWILSEFESPQNVLGLVSVPKFNGLINWTMTYRRDSDILVTHGYFRKNGDFYYDVTDVETILESKAQNRVAVAFISNCKAKSKRLAFIRELRSRGVPVDVYGKCGDMRCNTKKRHKNSWNVANDEQNGCFGNILPKYKFFLSLENSLCKDYVTEKSLNSVLSQPIVPVIRDGANRSIYHPPGSFIDSKQFSTVGSLALFLLRLNKNSSAYSSYFKWRDFYHTEGVTKEWGSAICEICHRVNNQNRYRRLYKDIESWFKSPGDGEPACSLPKDVFGKDEIDVNGNDLYFG